MFPRWRTMGNPFSDTLGVAILLLPISFSYRELKNFIGSNSIKKITDSKDMTRFNLDQPVH